jgi:hypothetical protein
MTQITSCHKILSRWEIIGGGHQHYISKEMLCKKLDGKETTT